MTDDDLVKAREAERVMHEERNKLEGEIEALKAERDALARDAAITQAARDVLDERRRQQEAEGWDTTHDDDLHEDGELAAAAAAYALHSTARLGASMPRPAFWPWDEQWWKPKGARRDLVRAGALILAEIERLDRSAMKGASDES